MADDVKPAVELEQEARAINATDREPLPGMVKRQCPKCRYYFAASPNAVESRCPDCARLTRSAAPV